MYLDITIYGEVNMVKTTHKYENVVQLFKTMHTTDKFHIAKLSNVDMSIENICDS